VEAKRIARPIGGEPPVEAEAEASGPQWTFVKQRGLGQTLRFKDGSNFKFRQIRTSGGFLSSSHVTTTDEKLANNLRTLAETGNYGVVEVHPQN